ncbi:MAG: hypothetical protein ACK559_04260, partial [bacterium]
VLRECVSVLPNAQSHREQVHQGRRTLNQAVVQGQRHRVGLSQAAVHADSQRRHGVGSLLEGFHHGDVVDWAVPGSHLLFGDLLEHSALNRFVELRVEFFRTALLG